MSTTKRRKQRSDKNKNRKHEHRNKYDGVNIDQRILLINPIEEIINKLQNSDNTNLDECLAEPPAYDPSKDYYREYYRMYLKNENLLSDID